MMRGLNKDEVNTTSGQTDNIMLKWLDFYASIWHLTLIFIMLLSNYVSPIVGGMILCQEVMLLEYES